MGFPDIGSRRTIVWLLPLLGLVFLVALALSVEAVTPLDNETPPNPPAYYNFDTAYNVGIIELGTPITFRRDGGGDDDYLKMLFLSVDDLVNVAIDTNDTMAATIDFWVSDPNKFPVYFSQFNFDVGDPNTFSFEFGVIMTGTYYIHTGQGFGSTYINFTITRTRISPSPAQKDTNNKPTEKLRLTAPATQPGTGGLPWDPSDFYFVTVNPTADLNKYLSISLDNDTDIKVQWELYSSTGILRTAEDYKADLVGSPPFGSKTQPLVDWPVLAAGDYIIRVWVMYGYGAYTLKVSELQYPNDHNNTIDEAYQVFDNTELTADINLSFDWDDYDKIYLLAKQPLWIWLKPDLAPVDVYLVDENDLSITSSRAPGLDEEHIYNWVPDDDGYYYIRISAVDEPEFPYPPTTNYQLKVWINSAPKTAPGALLKISIKEDTINESYYSVADWFVDTDTDDALTFDLDMSYNNTLIDVQLLLDNHLRIAPVANASRFSINILVNATDLKDLWVNHTVTITVTPVNDEPTYDPADVPAEIRIGEDLTKSGVNLTRAFRDIDDGYGTWTFTVTSTTHIQVELDDVTWLATFTPLVTDWTGTEYITVECTDSGDETVSFQVMVVIYEINDPPTIGHYMEAITMYEEVPLTIDLVNNASGAFFRDPEGKTLTYGWANNSSVMVSIEDGVLTLLGIKDFSGVITSMSIWSLDELGAKSSPMPLLLNVLDTPDPPTITPIKPTVTIQEGDTVTFDEGVYYSFYDPDSEQISLAWKWFVDGVEVPATDVADRFAYSYKAPITPQKDRIIIVKLLVVDAMGSDDANWTVTVTNKNQAPANLNVTTPDRPPYYLGKEITFIGNASDIDGDALTYEWFLDQTNPMGTGPTIKYKDFLTNTPHTVTLKVTDPSGAETTKDYAITIVKKDTDDGPGFSGPLVFGALAAVVAVLVLSRRRK